MNDKQAGKMMRLLVSLLALCWTCPLQAQMFGAFFNGEQLYSYLTSDDDLQRMAARGYIAGVVDLHVVMVASYSAPRLFCRPGGITRDRTREIEIGRAHLNSSHLGISYAVFCLNKKN